MGHKSNPISFRLKKRLFNDSQWFANYNYSKVLHDDLKVREIIISLLNRTNIITNQILIRRTSQGFFVFIYCYSRLSLNKLDLTDELVQAIKTYTGIIDQNLNISIYNYNNIYPFAKNKKLKSIVKSFKYLKKINNSKDLIHLAYIAVKTKNVQGFCNLLSKTLKRKSHQQIINFATTLFCKLMQEEMDFIGTRISFKGRLNGKLRAKKMYIQRGSVSLHTTYATIAYHQGTTYSKYGTFGLKIWLCFTKSTINFLNKINLRRFSNDRIELNKYLIPNAQFISDQNLIALNKNYCQDSAYKKSKIIWYFLYKYKLMFNKNYPTHQFLQIINFIINEQQNFYKKNILHSKYFKQELIKKLV